MKNHEKKVKEKPEFFLRLLEKIKAHKILSALIFAIIAVSICAAILIPSLLFKKSSDAMPAASESTQNKTDAADNTKLNQKTDSDKKKPTSKTEPDAKKPEDATQKPAETEAPIQEATTHVHSYDITSIEATCVEGGYDLYTCSCGETYTVEQTGALGHLWDEGVVTENPSYESTGTITYTCLRCGATDTESIPVLTMTDAERRNLVFELVNEQRAAYGLPGLQYCSVAQEAADIRARELSELFSHTRPDGTLCWTVFSQLGITSPYMSAENIAYGYGTPEAVMSGWMNSEGHRANILGDATGIVIGVDFSNGGANWVQIFVHD